MIERGTPGQNGWKWSPDSDPIHDDWEWTLDYDYQPKGTVVTPDGDQILPRNASTSHLNLKDEPWL